MRRLSDKPHVLVFGDIATESKEFLKWCDKHPEGFVANGKIPSATVVVHAADCSWGRGESWGDPTGRTNVKLTSLEEDLLLSIVEAQWPDAAMAYCGHCFESE